jgi:hypothetical protein
MNAIQARLLRRIEAFCKEAEISESMFGALTVNDARLLDRLRNKTVTLDTFEKINAFLAEQQFVARKREFVARKRAFAAEQRAEVARHLAKHGSSRRKTDDRQVGA